ncbi:hypothetical protein GCM10023340_14660 [Nocardioides marinquilinus]|uniref:Capsule synthesis protein CapA domain-containing protein n=1 Tax=Nocardioides marinquilinus TaxID=1210400 RepID=A0ABP9PIE5_9ACTN
MPPSLRRTTAALSALLGALVVGACSATASPETAPPDAGRPVPAGPAPDEGTAADPRTSSRPTGPVTLAFAGDVHFEGGLAGVPRETGSTLGPMSRQLRAADLAVVNLESALTARGEPGRKEQEDPSRRYWFRSPPAALDVLARSGVDVASVANNHGADYGLAGVRDTLRIAERAPVAVLGVGADAAAAFRPHRVTVRGAAVAVHAADASLRESADPVWAARPGSGPGLATARIPNHRPLLDAVRTSAATDDVVVVYLHWGDEGETCPTRDQRTLARDLADAGADVVVGTHAHRVQGAGLLGEAYVSYGLGNFFWYHGIQSETGVLTVTVDDGRVVADEWSPGRIPPDGGGPDALRGADRDASLAQWGRLRDCTDLAPGPGATTPAPGALPRFTSEVQPIGPAVRARMTSSHDPARCPVPLSDLRHLELRHVDFDGRARTGEMVVHADVAREVVEVFAALYRARFPIARMELVDVYGGDDDRSMAANNTSGYNCRTVAGQSTFSDHAYGKAIDINPVQNPYVVGDDVRPPAARRFVGVDRTPAAQPPPGVIVADDAVTRAFARVGWEWGGVWSDPDYQHFSTD